MATLTQRADAVKSGIWVAVMIDWDAERHLVPGSGPPLSPFLKEVRKAQFVAWLCWCCWATTLV